MGRLTVLVSALVLVSTSVSAATKSPEGSTPRSSEAEARPHGPADDAPQHTGRFQLFIAPGHSGSPFLIDTMTGCIWHQVQHEQTKRTTFVEVDVENLHWSWGSGAQQILSNRVDGSNLTDDQKRLLRESLQKTACGLSNVVLTPGPAPVQTQTPTQNQLSK